MQGPPMPPAGGSSQPSAGLVYTSKGGKQQKGRGLEKLRDNMSFETAFERTMRLEGGYLLHEVEGDAGGLTYAGIAKNRWPDLALWDDRDRLTQEPDEDIVAYVQAFYRENFWDAMRLDEIEHSEPAFVIYDFGVNAGTKNAIRAAQRACMEDPREHDGLVGPKTIEAVNAADPVWFVGQFSVLRCAYYGELVLKRPVNVKFLRGWLNRVETCLRHAA
ncbi:MAG: hypothetical protein F4X17_10090 [Gemmatimonadetes bacterium]|nr:hypothetical protein [Gemmatimonadota bacterium]